MLALSLMPPQPLVFALAIFVILAVLSLLATCGTAASLAGYECGGTGEIVSPRHRRQRWKVWALLAVTVLFLVCAIATVAVLTERL